MLTRMRWRFVNIFVSKYALKKGVVIQIVGILHTYQRLVVKPEIDPKNPVGTKFARF